MAGPRRYRSGFCTEVLSLSFLTHLYSSLRDDHETCHYHHINVDYLRCVVNPGAEKEDCRGSNCARWNSRNNGQRAPRACKRRRCGKEGTRCCSWVRGGN